MDRRAEEVRPVDTMGVSLAAVKCFLPGISWQMVVLYRHSQAWNVAGVHIQATASDSLEQISAVASTLLVSWAL